MDLTGSQDIRKLYVSPSLKFRDWLHLAIYDHCRSNTRVLERHSVIKQKFLSLSIKSSR